MFVTETWDIYAKIWFVLAVVGFVAVDQKNNSK